MSKFTPVGSTFEHNGIAYRVVVGGKSCKGCAFNSNVECMAHEEFPCYLESREDNKDVIYVQVGYKKPTDLVSSSDLQKLQLTYEQLARIYALSTRHNDLPRTPQKLLDPDGKVWDEMRGLDSFWDTKYLDFKDIFLSLLFPEDPKVAERKKELIEKMHKIQEELDKL